MNLKGIIMGTGAPNLCRDGKKTKCAIILTEELGFIRVYPIPAEISFPVWGRIEFDCERNEKDCRHESYKIMPGFDIDGKIEDRAVKRNVLNSCILKSGVQDPIEYQNEARKSIALVKPNYEDIEGGALRNRLPEPGEYDEECGWLVTQGKHWQKPYISWKSSQGIQHKSHMVGLEVYEGLRKNPDSPYNIFNNLQIGSPDWEVWLLLGNMRDRRNVWVVVHVHRLKKSIGDSIQPSLSLLSGKPDGWPYSRQEETNASVVDDQLALFTTDYTGLRLCHGSTAMAS